MKDVNIQCNMYFSRLVHECNVFRMHAALVKFDRLTYIT